MAPRWPTVRILIVATLLAASLLPLGATPALAACSVDALTARVSDTSVQVYAKGSCSGGVRAIRLKADGNIFYELGAPEVTATWNGSGGTHTITAEVAGVGDNDWTAAASRSTTMSIASSPPTPTPVPAPSCSVTGLSTSVSGNSVAVHATGSCSTGVRAIRLSANGSIFYELGVPDLTATWNAPGPGTYTIKAEVAGWGDDSWQYAASRTASATIGASPPPPPPPPSSVVPSCGVQGLSTSVSGSSVQVRATGSCSTGVRAIRLRADGNIFYELGAPEVTATWNGSGGTHTITAEVAGVGDNDWRYSASRSESVTIGSTQPQAAVQPTCRVDDVATSVSGLSVRVRARGSCDTGVRAIRLRANGGIFYELGAPEATATWTAPGPGTYTIRAEVAGRGDDDWRSAASRSQDIAVGTAAQPVTPVSPPPPSQPPSSASGAPRLGERYDLSKGTQVRTGSGFSYPSTIPPEWGSAVPSDRWTVVVRRGPVCADGWEWWDIDRGPIDGGGTGWAAIRQGCSTPPPSPGGFPTPLQPPSPGCQDGNLVAGGAIEALWCAVGGSAGALGVVTISERDAAPSPFGTTGAYAAFQKGHVNWSSHGPFMLSGPIDQLHMDMGGSGGWLGFPLSNQYSDGGVQRQDFEGGSILWDGAHASASSTLIDRIGLARSINLDLTGPSEECPSATLRRPGAPDPAPCTEFVDDGEARVATGVALVAIAVVSGAVVLAYAGPELVAAVGGGGAVATVNVGERLNVPLSAEALRRIVERGVTLKQVQETITKGESFGYYQKGEWVIGHLDRVSRILVVIGRQVVTVITNVDDQYIQNVRGRIPG